jgi:hypothetical protein
MPLYAFDRSLRPFEWLEAWSYWATQSCAVLMVVPEVVLDAWSASRSSPRYLRLPFERSDQAISVS